MSVLLTTVFVSQLASAADVSGPLPELWISDTNGRNYAWLRASTPFTSHCGASNGYMCIALNEPNGKEAYAMALAAFVAGRNVTVGGSGTCDSTFEKVRYVYM